MARPAGLQGSTLSRVIFEAPDGVWQLTVLCPGCLSGITDRVDHPSDPVMNVRYRTQPYGPGPGACEFCSHEIRADLGL